VNEAIGSKSTEPLCVHLAPQGCCTYCPDHVVPSTPAPQGEPDFIKEWMSSSLDISYKSWLAHALRDAREERQDATESSKYWRSIVEDSPYPEKMKRAMAAVNDLARKLLSERESRKQAEDKAFNAGIEAAADWVKRMGMVGMSHKLTSALSKPVQEPAERERGK
jgi:hypothetical protein